MAFSNNIQYYSEEDESFADIEANDLTFKCRVSGLDNTGDAVILLHGFPETSRMWYNLIKVLVKNGYKVIAPDQRGYSPGARPSKVSDYTIDKLSLDIIRLADKLNFNKFHLIGHDWGSAVGWYLASKYPGRILTWTALSVPHLDAYKNAVKHDSTQSHKSSYISFFIKPILPVLYFKIFRNKYLKDIWRSSNDIEIKKYLEVFQQKGAIRSALNWYRANINNNDKIGDIYVPTLIIYGKKDMAIGEKCVDDSEGFLKGKFKIEKLKSGHWLIQESFEDVTNNILNHIQ